MRSASMARMADRCSPSLTYVVSCRDLDVFSSAADSVQHDGIIVLHGDTYGCGAQRTPTSHRFPPFTTCDLRKSPRYCRQTGAGSPHAR